MYPKSRASCILRVCTSCAAVQYQVLKIRRRSRMTLQFYCSSDELKSLSEIRLKLISWNQNNTQTTRQKSDDDAVFSFFDSVTPRPTKKIWWDYITSYTTLNNFVVAGSPSVIVFLFFIYTYGINLLFCCFCHLLLTIVP
jgi:hypothetical protein